MGGGGRHQFNSVFDFCAPQVIAFTTLLLILASVTTFCLETVPYFEDENSTEHKTLYIVEAVCVAWFTIEFIARLVSCPNKIRFFKKAMNWIDFGAILPFYLALAFKGSNIKTIVVLRVVRLIRVFRIFKLSRHSYGLQILGHTLRSSFSELFLLVFFLSIGVVIFSSVIYYAEKDERNTKFKTIPHSFWWAVVTMTTLGYGDMYPETGPGQVVGSLCAISGVLMIALPVPVIVSNFSLYYSHAKARLNLPKKKKQLIIGAANALKIAEPFGSSQIGSNVGVESGDSVSGSSRSIPEPSIYPQTSPQAPRRSPSLSTGSPVAHSPLDRRRGTLFVPDKREVEFEMKESSAHVHTSSGFQGLTDGQSQQAQEMNSGHTVNNPSSLNQVSVPRRLSTKSSDQDSLKDTKPTRGDRHKSPTSAKSLSVESLQGSPKQSSRGRRGRRGSLYVVGFTAKHWQNKALKNRNRSSSNPQNIAPRRSSHSHMAQDSRSLSAPTPSPQHSDSVEKNTLHVTSGNSRISVHENEAARKRSASMGTQTSTKAKKKRDPASDKRLRAEPCSHTRSIQTSLSLESNDSSGRTSDDSLYVHENLRRRRGSSPLIRQKAIFTFDTSDHVTQIDPSAGSMEKSGSRSPSLYLTPLIEINSADTERSGLAQGHTGSRRNSCIPAISLERKRGGQPSRNEASKFRPSPQAGGYVNGSYRAEEDERMVRSHREPLTQRTSSTKSEKPSHGILKESSREDARQRSESYSRHSPDHQEDKASHVLDDAESSSGPAPLNYSQPYPTNTRTENHSPRAFLSPESSLPSITEENIAIDTQSELDAWRSSQDGHVDSHCLSVSHVLPRLHSLPTPNQGLVRPVVARRPYSDSVFMNRRRSISPELCDPAFGDNTPQRVPQEDLRTSPSQSSLRDWNLEGTHHGSLDDLRNAGSGSPVSELAQRRQGKTLYVELPSPDAGSEMAGNLRQRDHRKPSVDSRNNGGVPRVSAASPFVYQNSGFFPSPGLPSMNSSEPQRVPFPSQSNVETSNRSLPDTSLPQNVSTSPNSHLYSPRRQGSNAHTPQKSPHSFPSTTHEAMIHSPGAYADRRASTYFQETPPRDRRTPTSVGETSARDMRTSTNIGETFHERQDGEIRACSRSPYPERTDGQVVSNGHVVSAHTRRPSSANTDRQRARAIFFGDSGISSVGSASNASMMHSLESDIDSRERRESVSSVSNRVEILNPIRENDTESSSSGQQILSRGTPAKTASVSVNVQTTSSHREQLNDILRNPERYESSLV